MAGSLCSLSIFGCLHGKANVFCIHLIGPGSTTISLNILYQLTAIYRKQSLYLYEAPEGLVPIVVSVA